jgi:UDP-N-acetylmuramoyl-L-alanyl-D-glutamate--2,6-diaminopimelate ligase
MSRNLSDLFDIPVEFDRPSKHLLLDSRLLKTGDIFFACQGLKTHGKRFIPTALKANVAAIIIEADTASISWLNDNTPCINVPQLSQQLGTLAAQYYQQPSQAMQLIGITGTNGKTSVSHYIAQALAAPCGLIGTLGYGIVGDLQQGERTTPDALRLQALFADLHDQGVKHTLMEVSSHALDLGRVQAADFNIAVFTNLSRDHLDYHGTMQHYGAAKARLFQWQNLQTAIINADDEFGRDLSSTGNIIRYSLQDPTADIYATYTAQATGYALQVRTPQGNAEFQTQLLGEFNLSNLLASLGVLLAYDMPLAQATQALSQTQAVAGRMELLTAPDFARVVIDYAHTPDALEKALTALDLHRTGKLYCLFGCGGERDQGKRPLMGAIAERYADIVILTDDNPRHESPATILAAIQQGFTHPAKALCIPDRANAIAHALQHAQPEDMILIAGKGHETYQEMGDTRHAFSDQQQVLHAFNQD